MSTTPNHRVRMNGAGTARCNATNRVGSCFITLNLGNITMEKTGETEERAGISVDHEGAMKFVIVVLLVYSLLGTAGSMILRFRQSATKRKRNGATEEANHYLKYRDKISADCQKARLLRETNRVLNSFQTLENQRNCTRIPVQISTNNGEIRVKSSLLLHQHPSSTTVSSAYVSDLQQNRPGIYSRAEQRPSAGQLPDDVFQQSSVAVTPEQVNLGQLHHDRFVAAARSQFQHAPSLLQVHPSLCLSLPGMMTPSTSVTLPDITVTSLQIQPCPFDTVPNSISFYQK